MGPEGRRGAARRRPPWRVRHRPEHTFAAYDRALALGADYIEQDLQVTSDGVLVVLHDGTLDRTVRGRPRTAPAPSTPRPSPRSRPAARAVVRSRVGGEKVPTLEEVFQRYGKTVNYYIETK